MGKKHYGSYFDSVKEAAEVDQQDIQEEAVEETVEPDVSDEEVAESFEEDVEAVEEQLPVVKFGKVVAANGLNMRIGATTDSDVVCVIKAGEQVKVEETEMNPDWFFVTLNDGRMGFALKKFIEV